MWSTELQFIKQYWNLTKIQVPYLTLLVPNRGEWSLAWGLPGELFIACLCFTHGKPWLWQPKTFFLQSILTLCFSQYFFPIYFEEKQVNTMWGFLFFPLLNMLSPLCQIWLFSNAHLVRLWLMWWMSSKTKWLLLRGGQSQTNNKSSTNKTWLSDTAFPFSE